MITLAMDLATPRRWQLAIAEGLARAGVEMRIQAVTPGLGFPDDVRRLFALERLLFRLRPGGALEQIDGARLASFLTRSGESDDVLDLSGRGTGRWRLVVDRQAGLAPDVALAKAALARRTPLVSVDSEHGTVASARLGTENGGIAALACEDWLARIVTFVVAVATGARPFAAPLPDDDRPVASAPGLAERAFKTVANQAARQVYRLLTRAPHWRVGWRRLDGADVYAERALPAGWQVLPDDGLRFYADPFFATQHGQTALFVEEFPHRTGRGVISAVCFGVNGPVGIPEPVLETNTHLSYPHVFERDGALWMIPESCAANGIDLYRCTAFPTGWHHHARLVDGVVASDATLVEHDGLLWLFATVRDGGGAFSDALHLWWAERLTGPWTAHDGNPVMIDIATARPAGAFVRRGGRLLRPVQDCRRGYGAALAVVTVTRLDREGFAQEVDFQLEPGPNWGGRRLHTLNAGGGFEAIDGSALTLRLPAGVQRRTRSPAAS